MARDYKRRSKKRSKSKSKQEPAPGWIWMVMGFGLGLVVAFGIYSRMNPTEAPPQPVASTTVQPQSAREDSGEIEQPEPKKSRFSFYDMLPKFEVVIPETERAVNDVPRAEPVKTEGVYVLQAGSFGSYADADRRRAELALNGVESRIQKVTIDDKTYHRVRIGPVTDLDELNGLRGRLADANVETLTLRIGERNE